MTNKKTSMVILAPVLAVVAGIFWGSEGSFVRVLMNDYGMNNFTILGTRLGLAALMMFFIILVTDRSKLKIDPKDLLLFVLIGFFGSVALNYCYNIAIDQLTLSLAAVLLDLCPIYTIIIAFFIFGEKITSRKLICLVMALIGCVLVSGFGLSQGDLKITAIGLICGFASGIFYALFGLISKNATNKGYTSTTLTFYSLLISTIICIIPTDWHTAAAVVTSSAGKGAAVMFFNSLCCSLLPYLFFAISLEHMDAGKAAILTTIEPAAAMMLGFIIFHEVPTVFMVIGMAVVIAALVLLNLPDRKAAETE